MLEVSLFIKAAFRHEVQTFFHRGWYENTNIWVRVSPRENTAGKGRVDVIRTDAKLKKENTDISGWKKGAIHVDEHLVGQLGKAVFKSCWRYDSMLVSMWFKQKHVIAAAKITRHVLPPACRTLAPRLAWTLLYLLHIVFFSCCCESVWPRRPPAAFFICERQTTEYVRDFFWSSCLKTALSWSYSQQLLSLAWRL